MYKRQALCHEIDHLNGILFVDKILPGTLEYVAVSYTHLDVYKRQGQTSVEIHVLQGEREMAAYNKTLGRF